MHAAPESDLHPGCLASEEGLLRFEQVAARSRTWEYGLQDPFG